MRLHLLVAVAVAGCAETAAFRPTENVAASGHGGQPAASYEIRAAPSADPHVHVNVWSRGAKFEGGATVIDMTMAVRNTGDQPVSVDPRALALEAYADNGAALPRPMLAGPIDPRGLRVAPGLARDIRLRFVLPDEIAPTEIGGLRLRWALEHDSQQYVQFTEFRREIEPYYARGYGHVGYDPLYGFYDPFWYPHAYHYRVPVRRVIVVERPHLRDHRRFRR